MVVFEIGMGRDGDKSIDSGILSMRTDGRGEDATMSIRVEIKKRAMHPRKGYYVHDRK